MFPLHMANREHDEIEVDPGPVFRGAQSLSVLSGFMVFLDSISSIANSASCASLGQKVTVTE